MNSIRKYLPKTTGDLIIVTGLCLFLLGKVLQEFFPVADPFLGENIPHWGARLVRDIGFAVAFSGMVIFGIRNLIREGFSFKRLFNPLFGFAFLAGISLFSFHASTMMKDMSQQLELSEISTAKINKTINNEDMTLARRAEFSLFLAKIQFEETGAIVEHLTPEGKTVSYQPTDQSIKTRQDMLVGKKRIQWLENSLKQAGILWAIVALLSVFLGFYPKNKASNNLIKRTESTGVLPEKQNL